MTYNLTIVKAANTTLEVLQSVDSGIMNSTFGIFLVIASALIVILNIGFFQAKEFMLFTGLFALFISGFTYLAGLANIIVLVLGLIAFMITMVLFFLTK